MNHHHPSGKLASTGQCFDSPASAALVDGVNVNAKIRLNLRKSTLEQRTTFKRQLEKFLITQTPSSREKQPTHLHLAGRMPTSNQHVIHNQDIDYSSNDDDEHQMLIDNDLIKEQNNNYHTSEIVQLKLLNNKEIDSINNKSIVDQSFKEKSKKDRVNSMSKLLAINPPTSANHKRTNKQVVIVHCCQELRSTDKNNNCSQQLLKSSLNTSLLLSSSAQLDSQLHSNQETHPTKRIKCIKNVIEGEKNDNNNNNSSTSDFQQQQQQDGLTTTRSFNNSSYNNRKMIPDQQSKNCLLTSNSPSTIDNSLSISSKPTSSFPTIENKKTMNQQNKMEKDDEPPSPSYSPRSKLIPRHNLVSLGSERNNSKNSIFNNKHMPWFGIDVGGTLVKVVFFDPKDATSEELITLKRIRRYLKSSKPYGTTGKRDSHLEMPNCIINKRIGTLHFIRFATNRMSDFLSMAKNKRFADTIHNVCATGGGAYKFEDDIKKNLGITLHKTDELDSIIYGIHYIDKYNSDRECYFLEDPLDDNKCVKVPYDFSRPYPYLVVNIGSGVSILAVYSSTSYSRISGSSIGGGTFLGLCCLLTQCETFDEAIKLAKAGSSSKIDKLVKDIYGGDYPKFNLSGDTVASSFGHMNITEKRKDVKREDLARALLEMVTINIGLVARMCAEKEDIDRVVFIGNFLRVNQLSMKLLSYAVNYWSKGAMKALFLEHEGYFGAVGCFVESTQGCHYL